MAINCLDAARYFIFKAYGDGLEADMTNMKLQKLLYYSQCLALALNEEPLFAEEIQAWRYGPVCPVAYHFYSQFEAQQLPIPQGEDFVSVAQAIRSLLEEVWEHFGRYNAYRLSGMTHAEFPWLRARQGLPARAASTTAIALEDMQALGKEKLDVIEREHPAYESVMRKILEDSLGSESTEMIQKGEIRGWLESLLD